ncbi:MAG TPA: hypothetical protein VF988_11640, partial [Verrucomicrobiae bacterium]
MLKRRERRAPMHGSAAFVPLQRTNDETHIPAAFKRQATSDLHISHEIVRASALRNFVPLPLNTICIEKFCDRVTVTARARENDSSYHALIRRLAAGRMFTGAD